MLGVHFPSCPVLGRACWEADSFLSIQGNFLELFDWQFPPVHFLYPLFLKFFLFIFWGPWTSPYVLPLYPLSSHVVKLFIFFFKFCVLFLLLSLPRAPFSEHIVLMAWMQYLLLSFQSINTRALEEFFGLFL